MKSANNEQPRATYLVMVNDYLVSQDLAETIADFVKDAEVIVQHGIAGAIAALENVDRVEVAFIADRPAHFATSPLAAMIRAKGGRVVLLGDEAEAQGASAGWSVLHRPFSLTLVQTFLTGSRLV